MSGDRAHHAWWDHRRHLLKRLRGSLEGLLETCVVPGARPRVVDLGCGDRPYESLLRGLGCDYVACDIEGDVDVRLESGRPFPIDDGSVDGVLSVQVLEHVWDLDWYLGESLRILKPGGWLLLSTHGTWLYHPHPTDYRRWTRDGLIGELRDRGFDVEETEAVGGPLAWTTNFRLLGIREVLMRIPVVGPLALKPIVCLANLRMAIEDAITPAWIRDTNACIYVTLSRKDDVLERQPD
jgi:SAM-dependent methyltransferase